MLSKLTSSNSLRRSLAELFCERLNRDSDILMYDADGCVWCEALEAVFIILYEGYPQTIEIRLGAFKTLRNLLEIDGPCLYR